MDPVLVITLSVLAVMLVLSIPIGPAIGLSVLAGVLVGDLPLPLLSQNFFNTFDSFPLMAVPFFILAGEIMQRGSMANSLLNFCRTLVGHMNGGLAQISILTALFYGALCGSAPATTAAVGGTMIPAMQKDGYPLPFATAVNSCAGCLGVMIPPSVPLILFGSIGNVSISELFIAAIIPGIIVGIAMMVCAAIIVRKHGYGNRIPRVPYRERLRALWGARYALCVPIIVLGGIYGGITTPTEAGVVAVVYAFLVELFITRAVTLRQCGEIIISTMNTVGTIFLIMVCANALGVLLVYYNMHEVLMSGMMLLADNINILLAIILVVLLILGTFMETVAIMLILVPMLVPLVTELGVNPVHFGVVMLIALSMGFITPPVGVNLFVGCGISGIGISTLTKAVLPFLAAIFIALLLITYIPALSLCLL